MAISKDEIFGPVVSVLVQNMTEVLTRPVPRMVPAAIWTKDIDKAHL